MHYDDIGVGYSRHRRADPRLAAPVYEALGDARSVLNVGAGAGSYEPSDRRVTALDPSMVMLGQRAPGLPPAVQGDGHALPFAADGFDAVLAVLTVHHWTNLPVGLAELCRVAPRRVVLTFDPGVHADLWFTDYFPEMGELWRRLPSVDAVAEGLGAHTVVPVLVPHDCEDAMTVANWRNPDAYLDPGVRACGSAFHLIGPEAVARGVDRLAADLDSGRWMADHAALLALESLDCGLRLVVAG